MQIDLVQGSDEWLQFRLEHFGGSEAAAMLGLSPYMTRSELLHMKATGLPKEYSDWFQEKVLDHGHTVEAQARPLVEVDIGDDLFPMTHEGDCAQEGTSWRMSASLDGQTLDDAIIWEHKQWNEELAASVRNGELPEHHIPQCQQELMVSGAEHLIFTVSDGTRANMVSMVVKPDAAWFDRIRAGWAQFAVDLAEYKGRAIETKPEADPIKALPALVVLTEGKVINSNLAAYKVAADRFIANISTDLDTDEDFANAENTVKFCGEAEAKLEQAKAAALAQTASIDDVLRTVDHIKEQFRAKRLMLEKLVARRKLEIKETILNEGKRCFADHVAALEAEIKPIRLSMQYPDFAGAMKNKRTLTSLQNAVDTTLANAKIAANQVAQEIRAKLAWYGENAIGYEFLFNDLGSIINKAKDDFELLVNTRISNHKRAEAAKAEALRLQIAAEELANAEAAQAIKQANQTAVVAQFTTAQTSAANVNVIANAAAVPRPSTASDAIFDAAEVTGRISDPTDEQILEVVLDAFDLDAAQAIARLERFDGAMARQVFSLPAVGAPNITMQPVKSSQIAAIGFDAATGTLAIQFPARGGVGSTYHYQNVTPELFEQFRNAESVGSFFGKNIKPFADRYPFEKVAA